MKVSKVVSVRNVMRLTGIVALVAGTSMAVVPGWVASLYFGERKLASDAEKLALKAMIRALGIALSNTGHKSVIAPPSKDALTATTSFEGMCVLYHWLYRFSGKWEDAGGVMKTNLAMAIGSTLLLALNVTAMAVGDLPSDSEESKADAKAPAAAI